MKTLNNALIQNVIFIQNQQCTPLVKLIVYVVPHIVSNVPKILTDHAHVKCSKNGSD